MRTCPECANPLEDQAVFCDNCGLQMSPEEDQAIFSTGARGVISGAGQIGGRPSHPTAGGAPPGTCSACGYVNVPGEMFCQNCGVQLGPVASAPPPLPTPVSPPESKFSTGGAPPENILCPSCSYANTIGTAFCENCGLALIQGPPGAIEETPSLPQTPTGTKCTFCGHTLTPGERFCNHCGVELTPSEQIPAQPSVPPPATLEEPGVEAEPQMASHTEPCPNCGTLNHPNSVFCDGCGYQFSSPNAPVATIKPKDTEISQDEQTGVYVTGRLLLMPTYTEIPIPLGRTELFLGRSDPVRDIFPDIDLSSFGGATGGVSRRHARLSCAGSLLFLEDLNSTNFTFLNQHKLEPNQRYPLSDGDEIRLGLIVLQFRSA